MRDCPTSTPCPVDCQWKQWEEWSDCTKSCGQGTKERSRAKKVFMENTTGCRVGPCNGGLECEGPYKESSDCFIQRCPDCSWSAWGKFGACPAKCNGAKRSRTRKQTQPKNADSFSGLALNCTGTETDVDNCDGRAALVKKKGYSRWQIDQACYKDPGAECFAKGSKVVTQRGHIAIEELQLGEEVFTIQNGNLHMTTFLGWIHKEADHTELFLILKTESTQITLSEKHVIFYKPKGRKGEGVTTTFADLVEVGDLLEVVRDGKVHWERVVDIDYETRKGIYTPLTAAGTILVDNVLASCYADFLFQSVADFAFLPVKLFPWLLDNEESQERDGLRFYPQLLTWFGTQINMVESYKAESNLMPVSVPFAMLMMGLVLRLSY